MTGVAFWTVIWTVNRWLRRLGLVLVVAVDDDTDEPTRLWIERARSYDRRAAKGSCEAAQ